MLVLGATGGGRTFASVWEIHMDRAVLVRMGLRRVESIGRENLYLKTGLDTTRPESIACEVIERCNFKCQYCHYWRYEKYSPEMSIEEWKQALLSLKDFIGRYSIKFVGGEPFLKKGFVDLLEFCHEQALDWGVITNGFAFRSNITPRVVAAGPSNIDISVDSPDAEENDLVRGAPGSLENIEAGIRSLRSERDRLQAKFPIRIKPTISRINFRSLPKFADWLSKHGGTSIDFHPVHALPFWTSEMRERLWPTAEDCEEMREVIEQLIQQQQAGVPIETAPSSLRSFPDQFLGRVVNTNIPGPCRVGMRDLSIGASGEVAVCWEYAKLGNVRTQTVKDIWYSHIGRSVRKETVDCVSLGKECANSCKDHRSLAQDLRRGFLLLRQM